MIVDYPALFVVIIILIYSYNQNLEIFLRPAGINNVNTYAQALVTSAQARHLIQNINNVNTYAQALVTSAQARHLIQNINNVNTYAQALVTSAQARHLIQNKAIFLLASFIDHQGT